MKSLIGSPAQAGPRISTARSDFSDHARSTCSWPLRPEAKYRCGLPALRHVPSPAEGHPRLRILIAGSNAWLICWVVCALPHKIAGEVGGRSAYDIEGNQLGVVYVEVDGYVLGPASGRKEGVSGDEVVNAGARTAPQ